jgi:hypothetical protein
VEVGGARLVIFQEAFHIVEPRRREVHLKELCFKILNIFRRKSVFLPRNLLYILYIYSMGLIMWTLVQ